MQGRVVAGRYRLESQLGEGGMGSVWLSSHTELGTSVAIKLMDPSLAASSAGLARFKREAQAAAALESPHVVRVFDYGVDQGTPYIAMELLRGESLAARLRRLGRLEPAAVAEILGQVARAIGRAHDAGIVHRDLKPDNIFLVPEDEREIAKVLDFGIAKRTGHPSGEMALKTQTGAMLGTPYYMSPEQAAGSREIDHRTDIWSVGVIACECLVGRRPFDAETLGGLVLAICAGKMPVPSQMGMVPIEFDAWFARCAARQPEERFATVKEAAKELTRVCASAERVGSAPTRAAADGVSSDSTLPTQLGSGLATRAGPTVVTVADHPQHRTKGLRWVLLAGAGLGLLGLGWLLWPGAPSSSVTSPIPGAASNAVSRAASVPSPETPPSQETPPPQLRPVATATTPNPTQEPIGAAASATTDRRAATTSTSSIAPKKPKPLARPKPAAAAPKATSSAKPNNPFATRR